jgi:predicted amidophosphoribosyltransferase
LGVRRWRSSIRQYQVAALRALKDSLPQAFVQTIANEMVVAIQQVYGSTEKCVVVPVPCGHSGENCLSHRLAHAVANLLHLPVVEAFETMTDKKGSSHPRKNSRRAAMKMRQKIEQPVILIDDVSTSGSHINEAATLLRKSAPTVWPVVWITS